VFSRATYPSDAPQQQIAFLRRGGFTDIQVDSDVEHVAAVNQPAVIMTEKDRSVDAVGRPSQRLQANGREYFS
jgi:hypothetical protein